MFEPILIAFLTFSLSAEKIVEEAVNQANKTQFLDPNQERNFLPSEPGENPGEDALNRAVNRAEEVGGSPWMAWAVKLLVLGEGAVIFWLYRLIKSEEQQRKILEGVTSFWGRENAEESTHRRFAMLLNAIGEEVLYVAQGDLKSIIKLSHDRRLMLFFREENNNEDLYFVEMIDDENVHVQNSNKEKTVIPVIEFFKKKKFSFIVFLSEQNFCKSCKFNFMNFSTNDDDPESTEIQGGIE